MKTRIKITQFLSQMATILLVGLMLTSPLLGSLKSTRGDESLIVEQNSFELLTGETVSSLADEDLYSAPEFSSPMCSPTNPNHGCGGS